MKKILLSLMIIVISILAFGVISVSAETEGIYTYTVSNGMVTITDCSSSASGEIVIPNTLGGYPVAIIGDSAFSYCTRLTGVTISDSVTSIGDSAFSACRSITNITVGNRVTTIGSSAFSGCEKLTSITIPSSVKAIGDSAFSNCIGLVKVNITSIEAWCNIDFGNVYANPFSCDVSLYLNKQLTTSITIPESVKTIKKYSFYMAYIRTLNMSDSVEIIEDQAFYSCRNMTSITLSKNLKSIGKQAFYNCGIMSLYIPDKVETIGKEAFAQCGDMLDVRIPAKINEIPDSAFYYCSDLVNVALLGNVEKIGNNAFYNCTFIKNVFYGGTETDYQNMGVGSNNTYLTNARTFYNCRSSGDWKATMSVENCSYNDGVLDYVVKIVPRTYFSGTFIIATYTENNQLLDIDTKSFWVAYSSHSIEDVTIQNSISVSAKPYKYKIFLWDSLNTLMPLSNAYEGNI